MRRGKFPAEVSNVAAVGVPSLCPPFCRLEKAGAAAAQVPPRGGGVEAVAEDRRRAGEQDGQTGAARSALLVPDGSSLRVERLGFLLFSSFHQPPVSVSSAGRQPSAKVFH